MRRRTAGATRPATRPRRRTPGQPGSLPRAASCCRHVPPRARYAGLLRVQVLLTWQRVPLAAVADGPESSGSRPRALRPPRCVRHTAYCLSSSTWRFATTGSRATPRRRCARRARRGPTRGSSRSMRSIALRVHARPRTAGSSCSQPSRDCASVRRLRCVFAGWISSDVECMSLSPWPRSTDGPCSQCRRRIKPGPFPASLVDDLAALRRWSGRR